ncbi:uncharacterized protein Dana_GF27295 [Drosophila ananassae]|uniref:Uncharacterized protein n=1 Tax=Drosophila ananassae TaxID=7217 RepID=A0A0P8Y6I6_DROAN|nr:uncharacterized protein Dana_GF27295 [Drosophila ananassae]
MASLMAAGHQRVRIDIVDRWSYVDKVAVFKALASRKLESLRIQEVLLVARNTRRYWNYHSMMLAQCSCCSARL